MRAVGLSDLDIAARAVMRVPKADQAAFAGQLIAQADVADRWRKRFGRAHASGGTGSLYAQAALEDVAPSSDATEPYVDALCVVAQALRDWRCRCDPHRNLAE